MSVQHQIEQRLASLSPQWLQVDNESHRHRVPANAETHFRVVLVSDAFEGQRLLDRQRTVHALLKEALAGPVHALALRLFTPSEWATRQHEVQPTPNCRGTGSEERS